MLKTSISLEVRITEIDVMQHVNNSKYLEYLECSREDWYRKIGLTVDRFIELGQGTVVVNNNINYRKEAKLADKLTISTRPLRKGNKSFVLKHEIHNEDGDLVTDGEVTLVIIDLQTRKVTELPKEIVEQFR